MTPHLRRSVVSRRSAVLRALPAVRLTQATQAPTLLAPDAECPGPCRPPGPGRFPQNEPASTPWHGDHVKLCVEGAWEGWSGTTTVHLTDGSVWQQSEYYYEYRYAYRPEVTLIDDKMLVRDMGKAVIVRRVH